MEIGCKNMKITEYENIEYEKNVAYFQRI